MKEGIIDRNRFDELTRAMAKGASRRDLLKGVLGGVAAGAAVTVMPGMVGAQTTCAGSGEACEMVEGSCCEPYTCFEAKCSIPRGCVGEELSCVDDYPCCEDEGLTCVDGVCAVAGTTASGETVTTVTTAGVGDPPTSSGWLGILAAGGAMAAAATVLRRNRRDPVDDHIA